MSRRAQAPVRTILPDPKFHNEMLAKFMNVVMKSGKKSAAERIIYGALDRIAEKTGKPAAEAVNVLSVALKPPFGRSCRIRSSTTTCWPSS